MVYLLNMVIFYSYVELPEGIQRELWWNVVGSSHPSLGQSLPLVNCDVNWLPCRVIKRGWL